MRSFITFPVLSTITFSTLVASAPSAKHAGETEHRGTAIWRYTPANSGACKLEEGNDGVAISSKWFHSGLCGRRVEISAPRNGKTVHGRVDGECGSCMGENILMNAPLYEGLSEPDEDYYITVTWFLDTKLSPWSGRPIEGT